MTRKELETIEMLLNNFLGYDVTSDVMLTDDVMRSLLAVRRDLVTGKWDMHAKNYGMNLDKEKK